MSGEPTDRRRVRALWARYLAGETGQAAELVAEIRAGTALEEQLLADEHLHRLLDALGRSSRDEQDFVEKVAAEVSVVRFVSAVESRLDEPRARPRRPRARRWALVAAPVALAAAVALWWRTPGPPAPRATEVAGAALVAGTLSSAGERLRAGQAAPAGTRLTSEDGRACLRLADGSQLCLERAARIRLEAAGRVALEAGKVVATVVHQQPGATFSISTASAEVTAIGTAFSVALAGDGAMITRVLHGKVRVTRQGMPALMLGAHEALSSGARWRMSSEEERDEWSLVRAHASPTRPALSAPPAPGDGSEAAGAERTSLLALADALRARGRLRDAQGICDALERRHPGQPELQRIAAELRLPPPAQPWNATPAVYRINAGGDRYVDPRGNVWAADTHYSGGHSVDIDEEIDGTDMDPLYRTERWIFPGEELVYRLPVPDGRYVLRLHFAEIWAGTLKANMRKFDVLVEGEKVLPGYDIAAEVGPMTATVKQVVTTVRDGSLDIDFRHVEENPKISAIEVFALAPDASPPPAPAPPTVFPPLPLAPSDALYRVNAGGREYVDPQGRRWEADNHFNDTGLGAAHYVEIAGTELDPLYRTDRRAYVLPTRRPLVYSFPVPPGRYRLRLHFAELDVEPAVGKTVFGVLVENVEVLARLDIFAEVGRNTALIKEVETTVDDGALDLSFRIIAGRPRINAIEVLPAPAAGGGCAIGGRPTCPGWLFLAAALLGRRRFTRRG